MQEIIRIDLQAVNCYLVKVDGGFILFDTGGPLAMDKTFTTRQLELESALTKAGCRPGNLKLIALTHGDCDHVANAAAIRDKYQTQIAMHQGDVELVDHPAFEKLMGTFNFRSGFLKLVFCFVKPLITKFTRRFLAEFKSFRPDRYLTEGDSLSQYGFEATVLHIPGHTAGSVAFLTASGDLICGDTFANLKKPGVAPNAFDLKSLDVSVARLKAMKINRVYPGHGAPFAMTELC